jgi:hypothetical protein
MRSKDSSARVTGARTERRAQLGALLLALGAIPAAAQDFSLHGMVDARAVSAPEETSWVDGGLGKTRFGGDDRALQFGSGVLVGSAQVTPSLLLTSTVQYVTTGGGEFSALEAYLRYRPVSTTPWRWSVKAGEFFPPISLENEGIGWTSPWTLTPSAINSWVGEELRTFGVEARVEHRGEGQTFEAGAAAFWANDPAGELLSARGWSLSDLTTGVGAKLREPDADAIASGDPVPARFDPFQEIDHRVGWHADLTWRAPSLGRVTLLRYDNNADASTHTDVYSWHTYFWSLAGQTNVGGVELIAQGMTGSTDIDPSSFFHGETHFHAAFLLAGYDIGRWRPALRFDAFALHDVPPGISEHGNAVTGALSWRPRDWLRITGEVLRVDSWRNQREAEGHSARSIGTQVQLAARVYF